MYKKAILIFFLLLEIIFSNLPTRINAQDSEPTIPSQMPSPPKPPARQGGGAGVGNGLQTGSVLPNPPPQNTPNVPPPGAGGQPVPPPPPVIFGLNHIILILVPQFKTTIPNLPKWMGANAKVSLPITVFFDKLKYSEAPPPAGPIPPDPFAGPFFPGGHFVKKRSVEIQVTQAVGPPKTANSLNTDNKNTQTASGSSHPSHLNETIYRAERVTLIPKLAKLLSTFGIEGKACILRAICEVHEVPLHQHGYGLIGEVFTLFFSISKSAFADTHLSEYLKAEEEGKHGDCSIYFKDCQNSLFYWEKIENGTETFEIDDEIEEELEMFRSLS